MKIPFIPSLGSRTPARRSKTVRTGRARRPLGAEMLERRHLLSGVSTSFAGGTLTVTIPVADHVTITENTPGNFTVTDGPHTVGGQGQGAFSNVKNITANISASGAYLSVMGIDDAETTGIPGNLTVVDTKPNNAIGVEVHDGLVVGGAVSIFNIGVGSTFVNHTVDSGVSDGQVETGVFLDPNRKGSYGSVNIQGSGTVGVDGIKVLGNVSVNLGSSPHSSFFADAEWVYRQDPDSPPWTTFRQNPSVIAGDLTVTGGSDVELYNSVISGNVHVTESSAWAASEYALLGGVSIGKALAITTSGNTSGVFVDFSTVGGKTAITQGNGQNVLGLDTDSFGGQTTFVQGNGTDFIFIDSQSDLNNSASTFPGGLPTDAQYIAAVDAFSLLPSESGSTFLGVTKSTQGSGTHQLDIGQDAAPVTVFAAASTFRAGKGHTLDEASRAFGVPVTIIGYLRS